MTPDQFRDTLRFFAAGVTLVTTAREEERYGLTVSAFCSVSADPPLVAVFLNQGHLTTGVLRREGLGFAVNVLAADQQELSDRFAFGPEAERFDGAGWVRAETGAPVLEDALAWLDCEVESFQDAGSHTLFLGRVVRGGVPRPGSEPLVYWNRTYRNLAAEG